MDCCTGKEKVPKRTLQTVYEKKPIIHKETAKQIYPRGYELRSSPKNFTEQEIQSKKKELKNIKSEFLATADEASTIKQVRSKQNGVKLKKLARCHYDLEDLDKRYKGTKDKFDDNDFNYEELNFDGRVRGQGQEREIEWMRPEEFIDSPQLFPQEVSPNDIIQNRLNDCYFLSACASLAQRPYRVHQLFTTQEYNPNGYYICKLNFNGIYQQVIVDDLFPVIIKTKEALCAKPAQNKYIWVMVLQKCWAKFLKGYSNCHYGYTNEAFQCLTGAPTKAFLLRQYADIDPGFNNLFQHLKNSDEKNHAIQVTRDGAKGQTQRQKWFQKKQAYEEGLPLGHAYSCVLIQLMKIGAYETKLKNGETVKLMQIRNPWAESESKLTWNDEDPIWDQVYPEQKQRMQYRLNKGPNDGVFYMNWEMFTKKFSHIFSICEINDEANYTYLPLEVTDRKPVYFEIDTDGDPEELGVYFVQEMQQHFRDQYTYNGVSAILSKQLVDQKGEKTGGLHLVLTTNYYNSALDNYFTLPIRKATKGVYLLRLYIWWPQVCKKSQKIVAGIYSAANFGIREVTKQVNDAQFIEQNCVSHAIQNKLRAPIEGDPYSWVAKSKMTDANYGYVVFHFGSKSKVNHYRLQFDERDNKSLYFLLDYRDQTQFKIDCKKGCQYVIIYAWKIENSQLMDKNLFPEYKEKFKLPNPKIIAF